MSQKPLIHGLIALAFCLISMPGYSHNKLGADELEEYFSNTTQHCRKEKDQSTCTTFFAADGVIKRRMHEDGARKQGSWKIDRENEELCITWDGSEKELCFEAFLNKDQTMDMYKNGKHLSTVLTFFPGNTEGL
jgi:hypothetical protein